MAGAGGSEMIEQDHLRRTGKWVCRYFACPCGFSRPVSTPAVVPIERWLADYPCPACGVVVYRRGARQPRPETNVVADAIYTVFMALAEPGVNTVADLQRKLTVPEETLRAAVDRIRAAGRLISEGGERERGGAEDAALAAEFGLDPVCPGCGQPWPGGGWCGSCARSGWHP